MRLTMQIIRLPPGYVLYIGHVDHIDQGSELSALNGRSLVAGI